MILTLDISKLHLGPYSELQLQVYIYIRSNIIVFMFRYISFLLLMTSFQLVQLPMASDVDLNAGAHMTEGFSGADLQALLSDAQLAAVHEVLNNVDSSKPEKKPVITDAHLKSTASKARPSVADEEKRRLYSIYSQFLDSKKSVAHQVFPSFSLFVYIFLCLC